MTLQTKLRYVDNHFDWLRQEVHCRTIHICPVSIKRMIADILRKTLTSVNHKAFFDMIGPQDQEKCLASMKLEENQKDIFLL